MKSLLQYTRVAGACTISALIVLIAGSNPVQAQAYRIIDSDTESYSEPLMTTYQHFPIFQSGAVAPRIMIVLDNSGSMNFPAYGDEEESWPSGRTIETPYKGNSCQQFSTRVNMSTDDGMEQKNTGQIMLCTGLSTLAMLDLDLGRDDDAYGSSELTTEEVWTRVRKRVWTGRRWKWTWVWEWVTVENWVYTTCADQEAVISATRFTDVNIPREVDGAPVVISSASIQFTARENNGGDTFRNAPVTLKITAQAADNPATLSTAQYNISSRPDTAASITWTIPQGEWTQDATYSTPDLTPIIQELITRPGWQDGNAMLFKLEDMSADGGRTTHSFESNVNKAARLVVNYEPCEVSRYYGYFDPDSKYTYSSNVFERDANGSWDGNFLNFVTMRRGDVLRKAVVGGLSTSRTGGGNATQIGITGVGDGGDYRKHHVGSDVSPYNDAWYFVTGGNLEVRMTHEWNATTTATFKIEVAKDILAEPDDFGPDGELAGVLQKVGDRAQWGNAWYTTYTGGGEIDYPMGSNMTSMITTMKNKKFDTSTPLAETLYVVTQYFKQQDVEIEGYKNGAVGPFNDTRDPYVNKDEEQEACAQAFCLLLTDGMSTSDQTIPDYLKDYAGMGIKDFPSNGSSFARDVALYMRTTDLRSDTVGKDELDGNQNIILYLIYAMGNNDDARNLLQQAAINGGFADKNGNNLPDLQSEWDQNGDNIPDTYFEAKDGALLQKQLMNAILAILQRAGSGTAVSVLATKGEGEGTLVQAIFNPSVATLEGDVKWTGMLHSLWVDDHGKIREDTVADYKLDPVTDEKIVFNIDEKSGDTVIMRYKGDEEEPYPEGRNVPLTELKPIWSGGQKLADRDPLFRKIFTYTGDGTEADPNLNFKPFVDGQNFTYIYDILKFLGVNDNTTWGYLGNFEIIRVANLLLWTIGVPDHDSSYWGPVNLRNRTLNDGSLWKLGDIIHSTPTSMAQPLADYDLVFSDQSYYEYYMKHRNRETIVFVGSNAGMLHAFTGWRYTGDTFKNPYDINGYFANDNYSDSTSGNVDIGEELWAYIPQAVLPHLKWLAHPDYTHVNYIDLRPRTFDAQIFTPSVEHPGGWGTVMVCGLGFAAGMEIPVNPNHPTPENRLMMGPSFFAMDVTDPRSPVLLWERSFPDLGMSYSYPNLLKVEDQWMLIIGSGPSADPLIGPEGTSENDANLIIVDMKTGGNTAQGGLKKIFTLEGGNAFTNNPVAIDQALNYSADAVYVAANYNDKTSQIFRLSIPQKDNDEYKPFASDGSRPEYITDLDDSKWKITKLFKSPRPITSPFSLTVDKKDNSWIYFGTGRYLSQTDKSNDDQNYIIGIKDPFFNLDLPDCNFSYPAVECEINTLGSVGDPINGLFDADEYTIYGSEDVEGPEGKTTFDDMVTEARRNVYQGWYRRLLRTAGSPSERVINKGAVTGGLLLMPTFTPSTDPCGFGGTSRLFGVYYETGTAGYRKIFDEDGDNGEILDVIDLGDGLASSLSLHNGRQSGGKVYVQKSTGEIMEIDYDPLLNNKSGPVYWIDDGYY